MSGSVYVRNRLRTAELDLPLLRRLMRHLLEKELGKSEYELGIYLVDEAEISALNRKHLGHPGPTDVITFDYSEPARPEAVLGELFVCVLVAHEQARVFGTSWQQEVARYVVHGTLHLCGFDDTRKSTRKKMKREEDRLVARLASEFDLSTLAPGRARRRRRWAIRSGKAA